MNPPIPRTDDCPDCDGRGFLNVEASYLGTIGAPVAFCESCPEGRRLQQWWRERMTAKFLGRRLQTTRLQTRAQGDLGGPSRERLGLAQDVPEESRKYVDGWPVMNELGLGLYLYGGTAETRTALLLALLGDLQEQHGAQITCLDVGASAEALDEVEAGEEWRELIQELSQVQLLALDGLGLELSNLDVLRVLGPVIDQRVEGHRPVLITSPLDLPSLQERYGPRIASRLSAACRFIRLSN